MMGKITDRALSIVIAMTSINSVMAADFYATFQNIYKIAGVAQKDQAQFDREYKGKSFAGSQKVLAVRPNGDGENLAVVFDAQRHDTVTCLVPIAENNKSNKASGLKIGQRVSFEGAIQSADVSGITLVNCKFNGR